MEFKTKDKRLTPYSPFEGSLQVTADTYYGTCGDGAAHMLDQALPTPFLKLLQDPCLPTFSLSSLPQSIIEDIQQITSPKIKANRQPHAWQNGASMDCDDSRVAWQGSDPNGFSRACSMPQMRGRSGPSHEAWRPKPAFSMPLDNLETECPSPDNVQLIDAPNSFSGNILRIPGSPLTCKRRKSLQLPAMVSEEEEPTLEWMSEIVAKCGPQSRSPSPHCFQCGTQVTPQWRAGPLGPRTLCNACGVKFKKLNQ